MKSPRHPLFVHIVCVSLEQLCWVSCGSLPKVHTQMIHPQCTCQSSAAWSGSRCSWYQEAANVLSMLKHSYSKYLAGRAIHNRLQTSQPSRLRYGMLTVVTMRGEALIAHMENSVMYSVAVMLPFMLVSRHRWGETKAIPPCCSHELPACNSQSPTCPYHSKHKVGLCI